MVWWPGQAKKSRLARHKFGADGGRGRWARSRANQRNRPESRLTPAAADKTIECIADSNKGHGHIQVSRDWGPSLGVAENCLLAPCAEVCDTAAAPAPMGWSGRRVKSRQTGNVLAGLLPSSFAERFHSFYWLYLQMNSLCRTFARPPHFPPVSSHHFPIIISGQRSYLCCTSAGRDIPICQKLFSSFIPKYSGSFLESSGVYQIFR